MCISAKLVCTDQDSSTQNIRYTEASGDTNDYFLINNVNGEIRVRSANTAPGTYNIMVTVSIYHIMVTIILYTISRPL